MTQDVVQGWEDEARRIGRMMNQATGGLWQAEKDGCKNVKLFYNPRWMFQPRPEGVKRIFVGIHPAGDPANPMKDNPYGDMLEYLDEQPGDRPHNQWIDGRWASKGRMHQQRAKQVFQSLYGTDKWETELRSTPCFNVSPIRASEADSSPQCVWDASAVLCVDILRHLRPKTIICNGFDDAGRSPWAVVKRAFGIGPPPSEPVGGTAVVKLGAVGVLADGATTVIGLPMLTSRWFKNSLFSDLRKMRVGMDIA